MVIFIKKIKTKEGINSLNLDKIKKDIPEEFQLLDTEPSIAITANNIVVAYKVKLVAIAPKEPTAKKKTTVKAAVKKAPLKKVVIKKKAAPAKA